jgi:hypothetical protein
MAKGGRALIGSGEEKATWMFALVVAVMHQTS